MKSLKILSIIFSMILIAPLSGCSQNHAEGINIGNLERSYKRVNFIIANTSGKSGNILFWIDQDGYNKCEHVFGIKPNNRHKISIKCNTLQSSAFNVYAVWVNAAKEYRNRASVAIRLK